ncbi:MAG: hypothetical protein DELT_01864 [Desulfovibrio sp.]
MHAFGFGEIAALITSISWAASNQVHTMAGRIIGGTNVVAARVPLYIAGIGIGALIGGASPGLPAEAILPLCLSAIGGIVLCDPLIYTAAVSIGPRLAVLLQSLSACITAVLGCLFLDESISLIGWIGILTATSGVAFVLMEGGVKAGADFATLTRLQFLHGVMLGVLGAACLAFSFLMLKKTLLLGVDPLWAAFLRMCVGGAMLWAMMLVRGKFVSVMKTAWTSWRIMRLLLIGCGVSTFGNCLSAIAMQLTESGIAATLIGLQPIMIIFVVMLVEHKTPTVRAVIGTVIAFSGTAIIFLR